MNILEQFKKGFITENPVWIQLLGLCPALATTTSLRNAAVMGVSAMVVLICSNVMISLLRMFIPKKIRVVSYVVIIAGFVSAVDMVLEAFFNPVHKALGVFIPLIVVNCMILERAENFASRNKLLPSLLDGIFMGLGFTFALSLLGAIREIMGNGTIWGYAVFQGDVPLSIIALPAGGFLTLGFVAALIQGIVRRSKGGNES